MFSRPSLALFLCVVILTGFSSGTPQNSSSKPAVKTNADQSFVVNNNCGLAKSESEMLAHIKATVDSIAAKSSKGIFLLKKNIYIFSLRSYVLIVRCWCVRPHTFVSMNSNVGEITFFSE